MTGAWLFERMAGAMPEIIDTGRGATHAHYRRLRAWPTSSHRAPTGGSPDGRRRSLGPDDADS